MKVPSGEIVEVLLLLINDLKLIIVTIVNPRCFNLLKRLLRQVIKMCNVTLVVVVRLNNNDLRLS